MYPRSLDLYQVHENISNVKKNAVTKGLTTAIRLFSEFKATSEKSYDYAIHFQSTFISEILSLPTIAKYMLPLIKNEVVSMDYKRLF